MNNRIRLRLIALTGGVTLMGLLIVVMTVILQRQADQLHLRLLRVNSESFRIADDFRELLRPLDNSLYNFSGKFNPADQEQFLRATRELDAWIDDRKPKLTTDRERAIMLEIDTAYDDYIRVATALSDRWAAQGQPAVTMDEYREVRSRSQKLFDLGQALAKAHLDSRESMVSEADKSITALLRLLMLISLGCLFVFGIALARVVYRDMIAPLQTRLVESQTLLERQEKLVSLGMLAAGVAHEIRNPLTAIKAALFIQQKKLQAGTQEYSDAKVVEREIHRLERIVNDFLLFARPTEPQLATVSVAAPLREVCDLLSPALAAAHIGLRLEDPPSIQVRVDPAQIKQVLINLVQNAADAVGQDGLIQLRARSGRKRLGSVERNVVILEVEDNGPGIPAEVQKRLFDPFFTTKESGTGLGLSIAASIVQKHGGALQYQTQMDYGTTFGIILPQVKE